MAELVRNRSLNPRISVTLRAEVKKLEAKIMSTRPDLLLDPGDLAPVSDG